MNVTYDTTDVYSEARIYELACLLIRQKKDTVGNNAQDFDFHEVAYEVAEAYERMTRDHGHLVERFNNFRRQRDRLLTLAVKWCDRNHHDWEEIKQIYDDCSLDDLRESGGIADAP